MRRVTLMGAAAVAASSLAFGIGGPAVAGAHANTAKKHHKKTKKPPKPKPTTTTATCKLLLTVEPPADQTAVVPPLTTGSEYGTASCGKVGTGLASLTFKLNQGSGEYSGTMSILTGTGGLSGKITLEQSADQPLPTAYSFGNADYDGTATVSKGVGTLAGAKGKGSLACDTDDSVHYSCSAKLKITLPPAKS